MYNNIESTVLNNGSTSSYFKLEGGCDRDILYQLTFFML